MVNVNKLRGKIVERGLNVCELANLIGIDRSTLYRKISRRNGENLTIKDADSIIIALDLNAEETKAIFFTQFVAHDAKRDERIIGNEQSE